MQLSHMRRLPGARPFSLAELVEYRPRQVVSLTVYRSGGDSAVLFAFAPGEGISREILDEDCLYWVVEGEVVLTAGETSQTMRGGDCFVVPARTPHAVDIVSRSRLFILTVG